jgi:hypothetical protein
MKNHYINSKYLNLYYIFILSMDTPIFAFDRNVRPIDHIEFDVLGNEEIKGRSALGRNTHGVEFAEIHENNEAKTNGLADPRLGTVDNNSICATCGYNTNFLSRSYWTYGFSRTFFSYRVFGSY